jgi:hypothetical protein
MKRSNPTAFPIFSDFGSGATLVDAANYRFHTRGGLDIGPRFGTSAMIWRSISVISPSIPDRVANQPLAPGSLLNNAQPVGFFGFSSATSTYGSNLYSTEFNLRRNHGWLQTNTSVTATSSSTRT